MSFPKLVLYFGMFMVVYGIPKPIITGLSSKWQNTPLVLEGSEFLAEESPEMFWKYVGKIIDFDLSRQSNTYKSLYDASVKAAQITMNNDGLKMRLFKFFLSLRSYSPSVEMFQKLAMQVAPDGCNLFFDVQGQVTCDYKEVHQILKSLNDAQPSVLTFNQDHIYPASKLVEKTVILYGDMTADGFRVAHEFMQTMAEKGNCRYVLRHFVRARTEGKVKLSGYGVELAIKSTEYKAVDDTKVQGDAESQTMEDEEDLEIEGFDFAKLRTLHSNKSSELSDFRNFLIDSTNEMQPIKVWQLQDLSFQAAARVLNSPPEEQLKVLKDVSQNFPLRVRSLLKQQVSDELRKEIRENQKNFQDLELDEGDSILLLNGMQIDLDENNIFKIVDLLRNEGNLINGLKKLGLDGDKIQKVLKLNLNQESEDEHILDIRNPSIMWVNDIENDKRYERWPSNLHELLRPAFPGSLRRIRRNMFHLVFMIDPTHADAKYFVEAAEVFWANDVPLRIGFSFVVDDSAEISGDDDAGVALVRAYNYVRDELDNNRDSFQFLTGMYKSLAEDEVLSVEHVKARLTDTFKHVDIDEVMSSDSEFDENRKLGKKFHSKSALSGPVNVLFNGALLSENDYNEDNFEQTIMEKILDSTPILQRATYMGQLVNEMNVLDYLMNMPNVVPRFNKLILTDDHKIIDFLGNPQKESVYLNSKEFSKLTNSDKTATLNEFIKKYYITKTDSTKYPRPVTMWIVADVESVEGRQFVYNAFKHVKSSSAARLAIIHNPLDPTKASESKIMKAIEVAVATQANNQARYFILKIIKNENAQQIISGSKISDFFVGNMNEEAFNKLYDFDPKVSMAHIDSQSIWAAEVAGLTPGQNAVVVNGKVLGPLQKDETFVVDDFNLMEKLMQSGATDEINRVIDSLHADYTKTEVSDLIMKLTSHLSSQPKSDFSRNFFAPQRSKHSVIDLKSADQEQSAFTITVVVDPASTSAQEIIPVAMVLQEVLDANVKVYMNCRAKLSEIPIKRFYRYVVEPEMKFKVDNSMSDGPVAKFVDMPSKSLLTLGVKAPEGWLVEVVHAPHDLDNIKLEKVESKAVIAGYELESFVLEGHAKDGTTGSPPRGLQFTLGDTPTSVNVDTIVMANLGYFQLKASPGVWHLNLRAGKSQDIYQIVSSTNTDSTSSDDVIILMDSFKGKVVIVKVAKKADKINENLIDENGKVEDKEEGGIWNSITSTFTGGSTKEAANQTSDVINIFSLASGHLYERLMRIMMVSVLRHTDTKVKFWVLKNYLSPQFKDFLPVMAKEYGFEYEFVEYKWPRWLRQQQEKQRTMWGYKILFLDVLFPLNVDKIIFVDADQIVRADLKELRDLDLDGNPYGYTPFCDDKRDMDGFRFWKGGYWASHLAGRKYHISAIYVVDLNKFRQLAAGDRLRGQYQGLSQDPNSLANLDQDLPNNMIHQVGIKSLPQEWLWCATWCSEESKGRAKTIDLCNNPLTKEPKLEAAVRIAPEWTGYDEEIKQLQDRFYEKKGSDVKPEKHDVRHGEL